MAELKIPNATRLKEHCLDLGEEVWRAFVNLRENYKRQDLTAKDARVRAALELKIEERWADWRKRKTCAEITGSEVALTPTEVKSVLPDYVAPSVTHQAKIGNLEMSLPEQIRWVKQRLAVVRNGGDQRFKI